MRAFVCWSGGKDSSLSFYRAIKKNFKIKYLLNMVSEDGKWSRSHRVSSELLKLQAKAIGIPILQRKSAWKNYEKEFKKAVSNLKKEDIQAGIFGDIDLQEHRDWVERVCKEMDIAAILPLWKEERELLISDFIQIGFKTIVVAINANFLGEAWLGRQIDNKFINDLKKLRDIDLCGEKGEYHSFVYDGPIFKNPVEFNIGKKVFRDRRWFLQLLPKKE